MQYKNDNLRYSLKTGQVAMVRQAFRVVRLLRGRPMYSSGRLSADDDDVY